MADNPYRPPVVHGNQALSVTPTQGYRPANTLVLWLTIVFLLEMSLNIALGIMSLIDAMVYSEYVDAVDTVDDSVLVFYMSYGCLGLLLIPAYIACVVMFCVWVFRANKNARALGSQGMKFTAGWSVGWFFIPFANLVMPFLSVCEIYRASDPNADRSSWMTTSVSPLLGFWWGLWIFGNILGNIEGRLAFMDDPDLLMASSWLGVVNGVLAIPVSLTAIGVVRSINKRQETKAGHVQMETNPWASIS